MTLTHSQREALAVRSPPLIARYYAALATAYALEGDVLACHHEGWRRGMAPSAWARAGRWYRAALEAA